MGAFILLLGLAALYAMQSEVKAECTLSTSFPAPKVVGHFGSKNILTDEKEIKRGSSQTVHLYCPKGFQYGIEGNYQYELEEAHMKVKCDRNGYFYYNGNEKVADIKCASWQAYELFESLSAMPDCSDMTLVVGSNLMEFGSIKNVAICYDLLGQKLKYAGYTAYPPKTMVIARTQIGQMNSVGVDIKVDYNEGMFKGTGAEAVNDAIRNDKQFQTMFGGETFEYSNLIQDDAFGQILDEYKSMLNILWLRPLRTGNWRNFLNALKIASENTNYDVRVGVSGSVSTPLYQSCNETRTLSIALSSGNTITVPAFIWAHVRALQPPNNSTDEFVAIGHNSPFLTNNERAGMCKSICDEITWLKSSLFAKLQQFPVYGYVQCCRLSDVAHKLDNFRKSVEITPTPPPPPPPPPPASKIDEIPAEKIPEPDYWTEDKY